MVILVLCYLHLILNLIVKDWLPKEKQMESKIVAKLKDIERENNVKVLFAIESGSRTWGFASEDSDWDVRFVYVHPVQWYLRPMTPGMEKHSDTISWMSEDRVLDLVGWDLKKALFHINKSNPSITEWLYSKIVYINEDVTREVLLHILRRTECLQSYMYHYRSMAKTNWKKHFEGRKKGKLKKYFYIIRPILVFIFILKEKKLYETIVFEDMLELCKKYIPLEVYAHILELLRIKRNKSLEQDQTESIPELHGWIEDWLEKEIFHTERRNIDVDELAQHLFSFSRMYFPNCNTLVNPCEYSFQDLRRAAGRNEDDTATELYDRSTGQLRLNNEVKILCGEAGWFWCDVLKGGLLITAFAPSQSV